MSHIPYKLTIAYSKPLGTEWDAYLASMLAIFVPTTWKGDTTETMVIFSMGSGSNWDTTFNTQLVRPIVQAILATGAGVVVSPFGGDQYGNATAMEGITAARDAAAAIGANPKVGLAGFSMGSLNALAWAGNNPTATKFVWATGPLVDLQAFDGVQQLEDAYAGGWSEATYGATSNPTTMANAGKYAGIPIRLAYSGNDPVIPPATATAFAAKVNTTAVNVGNIGHDWTIPNTTAALALLTELLQ